MLKRKHSFSPYDRAKGARDDYPTPKELYEYLNEEFQFDYDPCPLNEEGYFRKFDGLGEWGDRNFVNPPYSKKSVWIEKAIEMQRKGKLTVMLLPVDSSTRWFHDLILPNAEIRWLRGRLAFLNKRDGRWVPAKFASMICIFRPEKGQ